MNELVSDLDKQAVKELEELLDTLHKNRPRRKRAKKK
jgi:hypothetical protein